MRLAFRVLVIVAGAWLALMAGWGANPFGGFVGVESEPESAPAQRARASAENPARRALADDARAAGSGAGASSGERARGSQQGSAAGRSSDPVPRVPDRADSATGARRSADAERGESEEPEPIAPAPQIAGWVRDRAGTPVAGLQIEARRAAASAESAASAALLAVSARDGAFAFDTPDVGLYALRTRGTDQLRELRSAAHSGETALVLVVEPRRDATETRIEGLVREPGGQPVAGAKIVAVGQALAGVSDAQGAYALRVRVAPERRADVTLRFLHADYPEHRVGVPSAQLQGSGAVRVDAVLERAIPPVSVSGRIEDARGGAVAGAHVDLHAPGRLQRYGARADAEGRFELSGVEPGAGYQLRVRAGAAYRSWFRDELAIDASGAELRVQLDALGRAGLRGRLVDAEGRALAERMLWVRSSEEKRARPLVADDQGRFAVEDLPEGRFAVSGGGAAGLTLSGLALPPGGLEIDLVLDSGEYAIAGRVVAANGEPVSGAELSLHWSLDRGDHQSRSHRRTRSDADGRFAFSGLGPGSRVLTARAPGYRAMRLEPHGSGDAQLQVTLDPVPR